MAETRTNNERERERKREREKEREILKRILREIDFTEA